VLFTTKIAEEDSVTKVLTVGGRGVSGQRAQALRRRARAAERLA